MVNREITNMKNLNKCLQYKTILILWWQIWSVIKKQVKWYKQKNNTSIMSKRKQANENKSL